jgi:glyoxylase-like metal-dependent hydrolase (beta-lactamase superfamily II)
MDRLWGECLPVPKENLNVVTGSERIDPGGRVLDVAYTPGHASHHVSYYDGKCGIAFVGDAAGGRIRDGEIVVPTTPPPDVDPDTIMASYQKILVWEPEQLFVTHFGPASGVEAHGAKLGETLAIWAQHVRKSLNDEGDDADRVERFAAWVGSELRRTLDEDSATSYEHGAPPDLSWYGLARYWRKKS